MGCLPDSETAVTIGAHNETVRLWDLNKLMA